MNIDNRYLKESNINYKSNIKMIPLNNISTDFSKTTKLLNNNFLNQKNIHINPNIHNTNINHKNLLYDKKIFKNAKFYNVVKTNKNKKKRNNSNTLIHNNLVGSSLTEGNYINNNNTKKFLSIFKIIQ